MMRLDKFLAECGIGTRSEVKKIIKSGHVTINNKIVKDNSTKTDPHNDIIKYKGEPINFSKYIYIMLNKPAGIISATEDKQDTTVIDILPHDLKIKKIFPIGRLDKDTLGLLLLSNDGVFAHNTLSPKKHIQKTYYVEFNGILPDDAKEIFNKGIVLKDFVCKPAKLKILSQNSAEVKISEGKFHQVKRMFNALGCKVTFLKRTAFGEIKLDPDLKEGEFRPLNNEEMEYISKFTGKEQ